MNDFIKSLTSGFLETPKIDISQFHEDFVHEHVYVNGFPLLISGFNTNLNNNNGYNHNLSAPSTPTNYHNNNNSLYYNYGNNNNNNNILYNDLKWIKENHSKSNDIIYNDIDWSLGRFIDHLLGGDQSGVLSISSSDQSVTNTPNSSPSPQSSRLNLSIPPCVRSRKILECPEEWRNYLKDPLKSGIPSSLMERTSTYDLVSNLPPNYIVPSSMKLSIDGDDFWAHGQRECCASICHSLMVSGAPSTSTYWFCTDSQSHEKVSEFWNSKLSNGATLESDENGLIIPINDLLRSGIQFYVIEQKVGDMVILPSCSVYQCLNIGGNSIKVSWQRITPHSLYMAYEKIIPFYRKIRKTELYPTKIIAYHSLQANINRGNEWLRCPDVSESQVVRYVRETLMIYKLLLDLNWNEKISNEDVKLTLPVTLRQTNRTNDILHCIDCSTVIFNRSYHCMKCNTSVGGLDYCVYCIAEGKEQQHANDICLTQLFTPSSLDELLEQSKNTLKEILIKAKLFESQAIFDECFAPMISKNLVSIANIAFNQVILSNNDVKSTCHQCKLNKPLSKMAFCSGLSSGNRGSQTPANCNKKFCFHCLRNRYNLSLVDCQKSLNWLCLVCQGICNCGACVKKRNMAVSVPNSPRKRDSSNLNHSQSCTNSPAVPPYDCYISNNPFLLNSKSSTQLWPQNSKSPPGSSSPSSTKMHQNNYINMSRSQGVTLLNSNSGVVYSNNPHQYSSIGTSSPPRYMYSSYHIPRNPFHLNSATSSPPIIVCDSPILSSSSPFLTSQKSPIYSSYPSSPYLSSYVSTFANQNVKYSHSPDRSSQQINYQPSSPYSLTNTDYSFNSTESMANKTNSTDEPTTVKSEAPSETPKKGKKGSKKRRTDETPKKETSATTTTTKSKSKKPTPPSITASLSTDQKVLNSSGNSNWFDQKVPNDQSFSPNAVVSPPIPVATVKPLPPAMPTINTSNLTYVPMQTQQTIITNNKDIFPSGSMVWARLGGLSHFFPGRISFPEEIPAGMRYPDNSTYIYFFGDNFFDWVLNKNMFHFITGAELEYLQTPAFALAIKDAFEYKRTFISNASAAVSMQQQQTVPQQQAMFNYQDRSIYQNNNDIFNTQQQQQFVNVQQQMNDALQLQQQQQQQLQQQQQQQQLQQQQLQQQQLQQQQLQQQQLQQQQLLTNTVYMNQTIDPNQLQQSFLNKTQTTPIQNTIQTMDGCIKNQSENLSVPVDTSQQAMNNQQVQQVQQVHHDILTESTPGLNNATQFLSNISLQSTGSLNQFYAPTSSNNQNGNVNVNDAQQQAVVYNTNSTTDSTLVKTETHIEGQYETIYQTVQFTQTHETTDNTIAYNTNIQSPIIDDMKAGQINGNLPESPKSQFITEPNTDVFFENTWWNNFENEQ